MADVILCKRCQGIDFYITLSGIMCQDCLDSYDEDVVKLLREDYTKRKVGKDILHRMNKKIMEGLE